MKKDSLSRTLQTPTALRERLGIITESELFAMLNIAPGTGRNRQSAGTLPPHYKVGNTKFYEIDEVKAWLRRLRVDRTNLPRRSW